ncbi:hypothetical protein [Pseudorhodoferax sp. Leaf267]|uniref:hypothetical protein n=1 Tax=Pseudorhodoferax sp. Leaf267 TaxID=1736316 RepID=UPI0012E158C7|nr:hypothetical protein [Pseudorhodoferax sp. Leaf267]
MSLAKRYRSGELDVPLAVLQVLVLLAAAAMVLNVVLVYRHFTDDALTPTVDYLLSLKLAFPPILALAATYLYAFLTGESLTDAPKSMWRHIKNSTLQNKRQLTLCVLATTGASLATAVVLHLHTPPAYGRLVATLLGGSNDDHQIIKESIANLRKSSPVLADRLSVVAKVFDERRLWNSENKATSTFLPRVLIRQLQTASDDAAWQEHPLRRFALAEASSMLAQALTELQSDGAKKSIEVSRGTAIREYQAVLDDRTNRTTSLMRRSARQNIGNVHYYSGDCRRASEIYSKLADEQMNAGTQANRIAALVGCGEIAAAVDVGTSAVAKLQDKPEILNSMRDFVNLLTNTGFAKLIAGKYAEGFEDMQAAHDLIPDAMAKQNLALAQIGASRHKDALSTLDKDLEAPLVSIDNQLQVTTRNSTGSCSYIIRAVALAGAGEKPEAIYANVLAYAKQPKSSDLIVQQSGAWKAEGLSALKADRRPCGNLAYLPFVSGLFK